MGAAGNRRAFFVFGVGAVIRLRRCSRCRALPIAPNPANDYISFVNCTELRSGGMHHVTIRNVDALIKAALEKRARTDAISQSEAARQALARGLGVKIRRRDLGGIGREVVGDAALAELAGIDWTRPAFSDAELDGLEVDEATRIQGRDGA